MKTLQAKLIGSVVKSESGCWDWQKAIRGKSGYGAKKINGKVLSAHRVSYEAFNGEIPDGLLVLHSCDNRRCINPDHLFVDTYSDNMRDARDKGRLVVPEGAQFAKGHSPINRKLTNEQVFAIRLHRKNGIKMQDIATILSVNISTVKDVCSGRSYIND